MRRSLGSFRFAPLKIAHVASFTAFLLLAAGCDAFRGTEARMERARQAMAAGDYREANIELKRVLAADADNAEARLALAETSLALGDAPTSEKELRRALAAGLPLARGAALQGRILLATGQAAALLQQLNDDVLSVQEPERTVLKGNALVAVGDAAAAEAQYHSVLQKYPGHVQATVGLAAATAVQGRHQSALGILETLLRTHPTSAEAWLLRGEVLSRSSRYAEARAAFEQASSELGRGLELAKKLSALAGLADTQLALGASVEAQSTLELMRRLADDAVQTRLMAARIALVNQEYSTAVAELQPVVVAMPDFLPARFLLGASLLAQ
jgi:tetratricopeptide (TPR) repeat protein